MRKADRALNVRIETPPHCARSRIDRQYLAVRRANEKRIADFERRIFVGRLGGIARAALISRMQYPSLLQLTDVVRGDLRERRIAVAILAAAVARPVAGCDGRYGRRLRHVAIERQRSVQIVPIREQRCDAGDRRERGHDDKREACRAT